MCVEARGKPQVSSLISFDLTFYGQDVFMTLKLTNSTGGGGEAPRIRLPLPLPLGVQMCPGTLSFYVGAQVKFKSSCLGSRQLTP